MHRYKEKADLSQVNPATERSRRTSRRTLPVALLIEGRKCLVLGGGVVAGRKAKALLEAGAEVVLVAPDISEYADRLSSHSGMTIIQREYIDEDLEQGWFMVITATNDHELNRRILDACHTIGILCACPDRGWRHGDWISPAIFKHGDLTVSISTGGASCRRSRLIRDNLARHAGELGNIEPLIVGTDHRFSSFDRREQLYLSNDTLAKVTEELQQIAGIHEFMLLNTCNRIELVALATYSPALSRVAAGILNLQGCFYKHRGFDAFRHLSLVAAGLLSQIPRETFIRTQVKKALELSHRNNWSAGILHDWVGRTLRISNLIHQKTGSVLTGTDVGVHCETFLTGIFGELHNRRILVIGSGTVGKDIVKRMLHRGAVVTCCYHSHRPDFNLPNIENLTIWPAKNLRHAFCSQDAVICAVTGSKPVLAAEHIGWLTSNHPTVLVDLGMPRNISPDFITALNGVRVANLDDLTTCDHDLNNGLQKALGIGNRIVEQHKGEYERIVKDLQTGN